MNATYKGIIIGLGMALLGFGGYKAVQYYQEHKNKQELKPLTSEEIFNKNQDVVVLIKHSYVYVIEALGEKFYFRDYNPATGEISDFISYEEAKANPNEGWGTGFFIDAEGSVLTNRHIVDVKPNQEDRKSIIQAIKNKLSALHLSMMIRKEEMEQELENQQRELYYTDYYTYEYDQLSNNVRQLSQDIHQMNNEINQLGRQIDDFERNSRVTKTSFQFGIFFNNQIANGKLDNYIQYKSVKISQKEEVDLALLKPVNPNDIANKKLVVANMSKIDSVSIIPPKITQKVVMIGYNRGEELANTSSGIKPQITEGAISQNTDNYKMLYTIPAMPGSSGSPIFDIYGRVVGINFAGYTGTQSFNFGIQPQQIKNFLKTN